MRRVRTVGELSAPTVFGSVLVRLLHGCCTYALLLTSRLHGGISLRLPSALAARRGYERSAYAPPLRLGGRGAYHKEKGYNCGLLVSQPIAIAAKNHLSVGAVCRVADSYRGAHRLFLLSFTQPRRRGVLRGSPSLYYFPYTEFDQV